MVMILALVPLLFAPVTQDFYDTTKLIVLVITACVFLIVWAVTVIRNNHITLTLPAAVTAFLPLFLASVLSLFFASVNKIDALMMPLGAVSILALILVSWTLRPTKTLGYLFAGASAVLGLIALYQFVGMGTVMFPNVPFLQDSLWTPTGSTTTTLVLLAVSVGYLIPRLRKNPTFTIGALLCIVSGFAVTLWQFAAKFTTNMLPITAAISLTKFIPFGVGVENFLTAYTSGKPLWLATTPLWNVRFGVNADFFLHMTSVYGLVGLAGALFFAWQFVRVKSAAGWIYLVSLFLVPPTLTILAVGALVLALSDVHPKTVQLPGTIRYVVSPLFILAAVLGLYAAGRGYVGEWQYFQGLLAAQKSMGTASYNWHIAAISTNPWITRYHITFSQVNISLANSAASLKQTDENRSMVAKFIEQAISEAKQAVTLNPQNIAAWENLATVYQTLMNAAKGSDVWAAASYQKAISLDPTNPILALNLGVVLVHEKKYDDAIAAFNRAINLRPDFANAYYNAANAYLLKGDIIDAKAAITKTMSLVPVGSADWDKANALLQSLNKGEAPSVVQ